jgi:hypothetical protein
MNAGGGEKHFVRDWEVFSQTKLLPLPPRMDGKTQEFVEGQHLRKKTVYG